MKLRHQQTNHYQRFVPSEILAKIQVFVRIRPDRVKTVATQRMIQSL